MLSQIVGIAMSIFAVVVFTGAEEVRADCESLPIYDSKSCSKNRLRVSYSGCRP